MLDKEDYEEYCSCNVKREQFVPVYRVLEKLDGYFNQKDFTSAVRLLEYWIKESECISDKTAKLLLLNEFVGLYRKLEEKEKALEFAARALEFSAEVSDAVMKGTTYLNVATAYKAFGKTDDAILLYEKAKLIYETNLEIDDERLGGLYNNMATAVLDKKNYDLAEKLFLSALGVMEKNDNTQAEQAITYCNLADLVCEKYGKKEAEKQIKDYLERAMELLRSERTPAVAYACEKCAGVFGYYGFYEYEAELKERV